MPSMPVPDRPLIAPIEVSVPSEFTAVAVISQVEQGLLIAVGDPPIHRTA